MTEDTTVIKNALVKAIDQGATSVVPVFHSYGGIPGSDALALLTPEQKTKITKAVYISSFVVKKGSSLAGVQDEIPWYSQTEVSTPPLLTNPQIPLTNRHRTERPRNLQRPGQSLLQRPLPRLGR